MAEQREIMSKCYEERRAVADEQSKLFGTQKISKEKELRETEQLVKVHAAKYLIYFSCILPHCLLYILHTTAVTCSLI